jgi:hypothetical protein
MIRSIVHPSDLSVGNESAFLHGLRLALGTKDAFSILHSFSLLEEEDAGWHLFPGVRSSLVRWPAMRVTPIRHRRQLDSVVAYIGSAPKDC